MSDDTLAELTVQQLVLRRIESMSVTMQVGFTPNGELDIPSDKAQAEFQSWVHAVNGDRPVEDPGYCNRTHLALDAQTWREMGSPDQITITIEPGDVLTDDRRQDDMGPVAEIRHVPGRHPGDVSELVVHRPALPGDPDPRPTHDDVTSDDVRETQTVEPPPVMADHSVVVDEERRSV